MVSVDVKHHVSVLTDGEGTNPDCDLEGLQAGCNHNVLGRLDVPVSNGRG